MLTELCTELRNWFEQKIYYGSITIESDGVTVDGAPLSDYLQTGQYFRIVGSVFNDGVHQFGNDMLEPENTFSGAIWAMAVPPAVSTLLSDINAWVSANSAVLDSPFSSESFGGYSYSTKGSGSSSSGGGDYGWKDHFASRLNRWRKI